VNERERTHQSRLHATVEGRVQGVGFRYFVEERAIALKISGWVRNRWDGTVEVVGEGEHEILEIFLADIRRGPRASNVTNVVVDWQPSSGEFSYFNIRMTA